MKQILLLCSRVILSLKTSPFFPGTKTKLQARGFEIVRGFVPNTYAGHAVGFGGKTVKIDEPTGANWNDTAVNERERVGIGF